MEIERKFWIDRFPDLPAAVHKKTEQGYLTIDPVEVRIRGAENCDTGEKTYRLTIKSKGLLARTEVETPLEESQYLELKKLLDKPMICKDYRAYQLEDGNILECSIVDDGAFAYAEVEFPSVEAAEAWQPLPFLGRETTYDKGFRMHTYWMNRTVPEWRKRP